MKKTRRFTVGLSIMLLTLTMLFMSDTMDVHAAAKINAKSATVYVGRTKTLKMLNTKKTVKWRTSEAKIATVSKKGVVKGVKAGKAVITAQIGAKKYNCNITVKNNVSVDKTNVTLNKGKSIKVMISVKKNVDYASFKVGNADVVSCKWGKWKGKTIPLTITAKNGGTTTVTITNTYSKEKIRIKVRVPQLWERVKVVIPETIGEKNFEGNRVKILKYKFHKDYAWQSYYTMDITFQLVQYKNTRRSNWGEYFACYDKQGRIIENCHLYASPLILNQKYYHSVSIPEETVKIVFMEYPEAIETPSKPVDPKEWTDEDVKMLKNYIKSANEYAQNAYDKATKMKGQTASQYGVMAKTYMNMTVGKLQNAYDLAGKKKELMVYDSDNNPIGTFQEIIAETIAKYDGREELANDDRNGIFAITSSGNLGVKNLQIIVSKNF